MKKIKRIIVAVFIMSVVLTSCTKDEGPVDFNYLQGKWLFNKSQATSNGITIDYPTDYFKNEDGCPKDYIEILASAVVKNGDYPSSCTLNEKTGTWSENTTDNTLTIVVPSSNLNTTFRVSSLSTTELILKVDGTLNGQSGTFTLFFNK